MLPHFEGLRANSSSILDGGLLKVNKKINMIEEERIKKGEAFLKEYGELVQKHQMDFAAYPVFVPDGQGGFKIVVQSTPIDISNQPKKSPFIAKD